MDVLEGSEAKQTDVGGGDGHQRMFPRGRVANTHGHNRRRWTWVDAPEVKVANTQTREEEIGMRDVSWERWLPHRHRRTRWHGVDILWGGGQTD